MKTMKGQPKTIDEYIDLMHQAVYEVDELRVIIGDEEDRYAAIIPVVDALDQQLRKMYDDILSGRYQFDPNGPDLPCMALADKLGKHMPFKPLLKIINHTHRFGLHVEE